MVVVLLAEGFCVCVYLCLLRCSVFQLHLCLLDLGTGVWSVFILSKMTVFALGTLSTFVDCCGAPAQDGERNNQWE